ncbi:DUF3305 domain-containing protein [Thioalkalivibrio sp. HK1]|uniref:DUF3305 domain-containing protein n=1 Tax=Thioalkalivibrio sp. HK1 TaxID=1469245 RepID=UPI0004B5E657|nr:DUF3305 domain-containing protein [Thioalkalivibrio sp. HK1]
MSEAGAPTLRIPVSVVLQRRIARVGRWSQVQWEAVAAIAGDEAEAASSQGTAVLVHEESECRRYLWPNLNLSLFEDACESYWHNLKSDRPSLFVVCFEADESGDDDHLDIFPALITASQDEANAHLESDDPVYRVPMPDKIVALTERYVVDHYRPEIKKKRRREKWDEERNPDLEAMPPARGARSG